MDRYDEQLLLGYVEGTLTPEQLVQVDRLLAGDDRLSSLLTKISEDRRQVQSLPREKAPAGLLDPVQLQLERQMLLGDIAADLQASGGTSGGGASGGDPVRRMRRMRIFSRLAVAALVLVSASVVMVMVVLPELFSGHSRDTVNLAKLPEVPRPTASTKDGSATLSDKAMARVDPRELGRNPHDAARHVPGSEASVSDPMAGALARSESALRGPLDGRPTMPSMNEAVRKVRETTDGSRGELAESNQPFGPGYSRVAATQAQDVTSVMEDASAAASTLADASASPRSTTAGMVGYRDRPEADSILERLVRTAPRTQGTASPDASLAKADESEVVPVPEPATEAVVAVAQPRENDAPTHDGKRMPDADLTLSVLSRDAVNAVESLELWAKSHGVRQLQTELSPDAIGGLEQPRILLVELNSEQLQWLYEKANLPLNQSAQLLRQGEPVVHLATVTTGDSAAHRLDPLMAQPPAADQDGQDLSSDNVDLIDANRYPVLSRLLHNDEKPGRFTPVLEPTDRLIVRIEVQQVGTVEPTPGSRRQPR